MKDYNKQILVRNSVKHIYQEMNNNFNSGFTHAANIAFLKNILESLSVQIDIEELENKIL